MGKIKEEIGMSEKEFNDQFRSAEKLGEERLKQLPKAASARYDKKSKRMVFEMQNGVTLFIPINLIQGLAGDKAKLLDDFQLLGGGSQIHWQKLDVQFYIEDLLKGVFGTPKWMNSLSEHLAEAGRKGGSKKSEAKVNSSRANGAKGGRPVRKVA